MTSISNYSIPDLVNQISPLQRLVIDLLDLPKPIIHITMEYFTGEEICLLSKFEEIESDFFKKFPFRNFSYISPRLIPYEISAKIECFANLLKICNNYEYKFPKWNIEHSLSINMCLDKSNKLLIEHQKRINAIVKDVKENTNDPGSIKDVEDQMESTIYDLTQLPDVLNAALLVINDQRRFKTISDFEHNFLHNFIYKLKDLKKQRENPDLDKPRPTENDPKKEIEFKKVHEAFKLAQAVELTFLNSNKPGTSQNKNERNQEDETKDMLMTILELQRIQVIGVTCKLRINNLPNKNQKK